MRGSETEMHNKTGRKKKEKREREPEKKERKGKKKQKKTERRAERAPRGGRRSGSRDTEKTADIYSRERSALDACARKRAFCIGSQSRPTGPRAM